MSIQKTKRPLDDLSDDQFKALADAATTTKQYGLTLHAVNLASFLAVIVIALHVATYIRTSPPFEHRVFLCFTALVLLPLALSKARELVHRWVFERALRRHLSAGAHR
jgi:hypothetical protein